MIMTRWIVFAFVLAASGACFALPPHTPVPGGVAVVQLPESETQPTVLFNDKPVMVVKVSNNWHAVVGIPLSQQAGTLGLFGSNESGKFEMAFDVVDKEYESQYLTIKNKRQVNPNAQDLEKIGQDRKEIDAALARFSEGTNQDNTKFIAPVEGRRSSSFGLRRFFNNQPRRPHSGMDIAAPTGTSIKSPAAGLVVETGDYFFQRPHRSG